MLANAVKRDEKVRPLLQVENLTKVFGGGRNEVVAVDDISFAIAPGEIVSLLGESGSGKTTTARMILRLSRPTKGRILYEGKDITKKSALTTGAGRRPSFRIPSPASIASTRCIAFWQFRLADNDFSEDERRLMEKAMDGCRAKCLGALI